MSEAISLDPLNWQATRQQAHRMLDEMLDFVQEVRQRPVWQPAPPAVATQFQESLPETSTELPQVYERFREQILPYSIGNTHPGFMGWVHGGGSVAGMLAEMLAAGLNANLGGRDQVPILVEEQIVQWMRELFHFPRSATGLMVTGSSMANLMAIWIARYHALGPLVRAQGVSTTQQRPVIYASTGVHGCIDRAVDLAGLGTESLRKLPVDRQHRLRLDALISAIALDKAAGKQPICVVATAGTVDVGAIDDLTAIAEVARQHKLWLHVDGACGALGQFSSAIAQKLRGIEQADSIALDFHKWGQVPYDAGFLLVRDGAIHRATFATQAAYLRRETRGMAAGSFWPCDYGPDLSRSFKALKVWFTLQVYGRQRLARMMEHTCELALYLAERITREGELELAAEVSLNIVCFRYRAKAATQPVNTDDFDADDFDADKINAAIVVDVQESGTAAPSITTVDGRMAIRAAIFNHRATRDDVDRLLDAVLASGRRLSHTTHPVISPTLHKVSR